MATEDTYTREEIEGALTSKDALDAIQAVLRNPANKSKPGTYLAEEIALQAIEAGFGPK